jgi:hypothetical protein
MLPLRNGKRLSARWIFALVLGAGVITNLSFAATTTPLPDVVRVPANAVAAAYYDEDGNLIKKGAVPIMEDLFKHHGQQIDRLRLREETPGGDCLAQCQVPIGGYIFCRRGCP